MTENIIAVCIFIAAIAGIVFLVVNKMRKKNENLTIEEFLEANYDNLIGALQDVVAILMININDFASKEDYEKAIIGTTIDKLNENCKEFGIDASLLNLFNRDMLTDMLYKLLHTEATKIFNVIPNKVIEDNASLYDSEVVHAAEESDLIHKDDIDPTIEPPIVEDTPIEIKNNEKENIEE